MVKDIRLSIGFLDHPKTIKLKRLLGLEGIESLLRLWCFAAQYKPTGILLDMHADDIEIAARWTGESQLLIKTLTDLNWIHTDDQGAYFLHDWEEHNGWAFHAQERSNQARDAVRIRWENRQNKKGNTERIRSVSKTNTKRNTPSPLPSPNPTPPNPLAERFERFFEAYPKKRSKGRAEKQWAKIKPDEQLLAKMIATIERARTSVDWTKDGGKYVPLAATWLEDKGWMDVFEAPETQTSPGVKPDAPPKEHWYKSSRGTWISKATDGTETELTDEEFQARRSSREQSPAMSLIKDIAEGMGDLQDCRR